MKKNQCHIFLYNTIERIFSHHLYFRVFRDLKKITKIKLREYEILPMIKSK